MMGPVNVSFVYEEICGPIRETKGNYIWHASCKDCGENISESEREEFYNLYYRHVCKMCSTCGKPYSSWMSRCQHYNSTLLSYREGGFNTTRQRIPAADIPAADIPAADIPAFLSGGTMTKMNTRKGNWDKTPEKMVLYFGNWHKITHATNCNCWGWGTELTNFDHRCNMRLQFPDDTCNCGYCYNDSSASCKPCHSEPNEAKYVLSPPSTPSKSVYNRIYWSYVHATTEESAHDNLKQLIDVAEKMGNTLEPGNGSWVSSPDPYAPKPPEVKKSEKLRLINTGWTAFCLIVGLNVVRRERTKSARTVKVSGLGVYSIVTTVLLLVGIILQILGVL